MYRATLVDPTNEIAATRGCANKASTHSLSPWTMLNTPGGNPHSVSNSPKRTELSGTFSDGFNTNVLPHANATGNIHNGTMAGKLNGVMPTQTPTGCRTVSQSTFEAILGNTWPMSKLGMPHANSTISIPRCTDARASDNVLPCSLVTSRASSSVF